MTELPLGTSLQKLTSTEESPEKAADSKYRSLKIALYACTIAVPLTLGIAIVLPTGILERFGVLLTAVATATVAWFTATLWQSTDAMQRTTTETLDHLRSEFLTSHRPVLRVRRILFLRPDGARITEPNQVKILIGNIGDTEAQVVKVQVAFLHSDRDRFDSHTAEERLRRGIVPNLEGHRIPVGHSLATIVPMEKIDSRTFSETILVNGLIIAYCVGYIEYVDPRGENPRTMGFIRAFNPKSLGFDRVDNPDFEYSD